MRSPRTCLLLVAGILSWLGLIPIAVRAAGETHDGTTPGIRSILARCVTCHGGEDPEGGLDLSTRESAMMGGVSGPALKPGEPTKSRIAQMVASGKMPPDRPLSADEVAAVRRWIDAGATWGGGLIKPEAPLRETSARGSDTAWALTPPEAAIPPRTRDPAWARNPIDAFILAGLEAKGLRPAPAADRAAWIRRATFDLAGLPPTPEEVDAFVRDDSPTAYETAVDRLLASPRYGERWGRHWLDVARFSESQGFEFDRLREHAWRYRDYVIRSFNADKPYPRFVAEQIAGDVIEPGSPEGIIATGFLVAGPWDEAGEKLQKSEVMRARMREEELEDMVAAVAQTFLGMTVNCARCHDHKFDPIPQRDYYRLKAGLEGVRHGDRPLSPGLSKGPLAYAAVPGPAPPTRVLPRGDVERPGDAVSVGGLSAIEVPGPDLGVPPEAPEGPRRRALAEWVAHPRNPLTARVMVNRIWHYHFGTGLVASPNDFGRGGERPSHPELLDWLACEFQARGGRVKALHRLILLSSTYRQSSRFDSDAAAVDADGRLLWRFPPRRLEAEAIRDAMLAVAGHLNPALGGPSFRPFTVTVFNSNLYTPTDPVGPDFDRRTVYRMNVDSGKSPWLDALDCPDPSVKAPRRAVTTTPLQALALMNDTFVRRQALGLGRRVARDVGGDPSAQVERAYRLAFGRGPTAAEQARAVALAREHGPETLGWALFNASEFLYLK